MAAESVGGGALRIEGLDDKLVALLERPLVGTFGTISPGGVPHLTAVWYEFRDGEFVISTSVSSRKVKNVLASPTAELCVNGGLAGPCVTARGQAKLRGSTSPEFIAGLACRYLGEDGGARYMAARDPKAESVLLSLRPTTWRVWDIDATMSTS
ncbi:MAG: pyridoxamine 5'-phosphate oxidase family protein [Nitrososphaerales archaeon]